MKNATDQPQMKQETQDKLFGKEEKKLSNVWTNDQVRSVKQLDDQFSEHIRSKNLEPYSKEAADEWTKGGFKGKFKKIFNKE